MTLVKKLKNKFLKETSGKDSFTTTDMSNNTITINKTDYDKLQTEYSELQIEIKELKFEVLVLQEKVDLLTYKRFVHSAENIDDKQGSLFNEDEAVKAETDNLSENAIRPFVIGRKNWLFFKSPSGAKSACVLYSLIETAKCNDVDPTAYLTHLFKKATTAITTADWDALLPWNVKFDDGKN